LVKHGNEVNSLENFTNVKSKNNITSKNQKEICSLNYNEYLINLINPDQNLVSVHETCIIPRKNNHNLQPILYNKKGTLTN